MKAKSGSAVSAVEPTEPEDALAADDAKPGDVAKAKAQQLETKTGKYGSTKAPAFKPPKQTNASTTNNASQSTTSTANTSAGGTAENSQSRSTSAQKANTTDEKTEKTDWIEIELLGEDDSPIAGEKYEITLPDGTVAAGTLNGNGFARVEGFKAGNCKVSFPQLDKQAWKEA